MKLNYEYILENTGISFDSYDDLIAYLVRHLEFLESHNKNYTKEQYRRICDCLYIIKGLQED